MPYMYTLQIHTTWGEIDACIFLTALNTRTSTHTSSTWQHLLLSTRASYAEGDCVLNKRRTVRQNNEQLWNHHLRHPSHSASFFALWPVILTVNGDRRSCIFWVYSPGTYTHRQHHWLEPPQWLPSEGPHSWGLQATDRHPKHHLIFTCALPSRRIYT